MKKKSKHVGVQFFLFKFGTNENCNVVFFSFNFHFCRKTNGHSEIFQIDFEKIEEIENFGFSNFKILNGDFNARVVKGTLKLIIKMLKKQICKNNYDL